MRERGSLPVGDVYRAAGLTSSGPLELSIGAQLDEIVRGWRGKLALVQQTANQAVADEMAQLAASTSLAAISAAAMPAVTVPGYGHQIQEALGEYAGGFARMATEQLAASLRPIALDTTLALMLSLRQQSEVDRRYTDALWRHRWWYPPNGSQEIRWHVGKLAEEGRKVELRQAMVQLGRSRQMDRAAQHWMELEPFRRRARFLRDGLRDHRDERFRVSIPVLLPLIEGILFDVYAPGSTATNPTRVMPTVRADDAVVGPAMADTVMLLWADKRLSAVAGGTRELNRHLIMHGRSTGYGTAENSTKVLFALDLLAWLIERKERGEL